MRSLAWPALLLLAVTGASLAAPPLQIVGDSRCPSPAQFAAALTRLLPGRTIGLAASPGGIAVVLSDQGPRYRITVAGAAREVEDRRHDCAERARTAAVFAALVLEPPGLIESPTPPLTAAPPVPRAAPRPGGTGPRRPRIELELGGAIAVAPRVGRDEGSPLTGGGRLRLVIGGSHISGSLGLGADGPVELVLPGARARLLRIPIDLSLRAGLRRKNLELGADVGLLFVLLFVEGLDLPEVLRSERLDVGLRLSTLGRLWVHARLALFVSLDGQISPRPYELLLEPAGAIGQTPWLWLGGTVGLVGRFR